jgi:hypothetical protein
MLNIHKNIPIYWKLKIKSENKPDKNKKNKCLK